MNQETNNSVQKHAFIVSGPVSSGCRLMTSLLVRAGCRGEGSTAQQKVLDNPPDTPLLAAIVHEYPAPYVCKLQSMGYQVHILVMVRDRWPNVNSAVDKGHSDSLEYSDKLIRDTYIRLFRDIASVGVEYTMVTYEGLATRPFQAVEKLFEKLGLRTDNLGAPIHWQNLEMPGIHDMDARWYENEPSIIPSYGRELVWYPERQMGFYPVKPNGIYNASYFDKYKRYAQTDLGRELTRIRIELVSKYIKGDWLLDFGCAYGQFIRDRDGETYGYDVMDSSIRWLESISRYYDPWKNSVLNCSCWDSLEHLASPGRLIERVKKFVFVSMPIVQDVPQLASWRHTRTDEHYWYWTSQGFIQWFGRYGFECLEENAFESEAGREDIGTFVFRRRES